MFRLSIPVKRHLVLQSLTESGLQVKNDQAKFSQAHGNFQETHNFHSAMIQTNLTSLHRLLHVHLAQRYPHLTSPKTSTATLPRVDAFWMRSGMQPDMKMVKKRKAKNKYKEKRNYPEEDIKEDEVWKEYDNCFQIKGTNNEKSFVNIVTFPTFTFVFRQPCNPYAFGHHVRFLHRR